MNKIDDDTWAGIVSILLARSNLDSVILSDSELESLAGRTLHVTARDMARGDLHISLRPPSDHSAASAGSPFAPARLSPLVPAGPAQPPAAGLQSVKVAPFTIDAAALSQPSIWQNVCALLMLRQGRTLASIHGTDVDLARNSMFYYRVIPATGALECAVFDPPSAEMTEHIRKTWGIDENQFQDATGNRNTPGMGF